MAQTGDVVTIRSGHYKGRTGVIISVRGELYDVKLIPKNMKRVTDIDGPGVVITNLKRYDFR